MAAATDVVLEHSTGQHRWVGALKVSRHPSQHRPCEYFVSVVRPDVMYGGAATFRWQDGGLVLVPSLFRNGKPRPINKRRHPNAEELDAAIHLIRAMGWES
ncbi:MAG TPA: hypothetical protein VHX44_09870 [Planctomycetota bacterium]|nr:hypothetical protein [Planctomycetota bacterium]